MTEVPEDEVRDLERGATEMEEGLGRLESDIETAQDRAAEHRERADPEAAAGDWEDESAGAQQGDDPKDAEGAEGPGHADEEGEGAIAQAPVHEATEVTPGGEEERDEDDARREEDDGDEDDGSQRDDASGAPVHEAEQVEPEGSGAEDAGDDAEEDRSEDDAGDDAEADRSESGGDDGEAGRPESGDGDDFVA